MRTVVEVAVDFPLAVDRTYSYLVPEGWRVTVGMRVQVPLGGSRREGLVVAVASTVPERPLKELLALRPDAPWSEEEISLARWLAENYPSPLFTALRTVRPAEPRRVDGTEELWELSRPLAEVARELPALRRRAPRRAELLAELSRGPLRLGEIRGRGLGGAWKALAAAGIIRRTAEEFTPLPPPHLLPGQAEVLAAMGGEGIYLLHGVTGSGKTEVYLQAAAQALERGEGVILLAPEIALAHQLLDRARERFGPLVVFLHSDLPGGERFSGWRRLSRGEARVAVGTRSAVFAPLAGPLLIVLDEEHDGSYKQEEAPRYLTGAVAEERRRRQGGRVVYGSATPAVETFYRAERGEMTRLALSERIGGAPPAMEIADLRQEKGRGALGVRLREALAENLGRGEKSILFLNRRGFAPVLICRDCGKAERCPHCDVSLSYHRHEGRLRCHYCGYGKRPPERCSHCGGVLQPLGAGTERVEAEVREAFPSARVLRLDSDTARRRGMAGAIYRAFAAGEADILIGTQMVAKGFHFPAVTLVGVVSADTALQFPDYRSGERTFQLLTQVAGRAGRGERPGRVLIQTRQAEHPSLLAAAAHDYRGFYRSELAAREALGYPPFRRLWLLGLSGADEERVRRASAVLAGRIPPGVGDVLGPAPALVRRVENRYRWQIVLKGTDAEALRLAVREALANWRPPAGVSVAVNPDPVTIL